MKRFLEIDIAKGIGIILVLIGHLQVPSILKNYLYSFYMPLFFFLGGAIYYSTPKNNGNKLNLIILYIMFGFFFSILNFAKLNDIRIDLLFDILKSNPISIYNIEWFGVFWFVLSYVFVSNLVRINFFGKISYSLIIFLVVYFVSRNETGRELLILVPFCISPALMLLFYYNAGKFYDKIVKKYSFKRLLILTVFYLLGNYYISCLYGGFDSKIYNFGVDLFSLLFISFIGLVLCLYVSIFIKNESSKLSLILSHFGNNSLSYFIWHLFVFSLVHSSMYRITMNDLYSETIIFQSIKLVISIVVIYLGIVMYNRAKFYIKGVNGL